MLAKLFIKFAYYWATQSYLFKPSIAIKLSTKAMINLSIVSIPTQPGRLPTLLLISLVSHCSMADREQYKYIDGLPNSHKLTISGLRMNTLYLFSVMSWNDLGQSAYLPDLTRAQTKGRWIQTIFKLARR